MGAAIVLRDDFDVLVVLPSAHLVLDADIREMHLLVEVREVVFARPACDLALVAVRSSVAVWPAAIRRLQPLLVLALQLGFKDDAANLRALRPQPFVLAEIGAVDLHVVGELPRPADARVEGLLAVVVAVAAVGVEEVTTALSQRYRAVPPFELDSVRQAFIAQMAEVRLTRVFRLFARIVEITFGHDPKRPNDRECPAIVPVQLVPIVAVEHDFAFGSARQFETVDKRVSRIHLSLARIAFTNLFVSIAEVILLTI